jgi:hypothetical protein
MKKVKLGELRGGALVDYFDEQFSRVLANIADENTAPTAKRTITLKMEIVPDKKRRTAEVRIHANAGLAPLRPAESLFFFDHDETGRFTAYEDDPSPELPGFAAGNIKEFPKEEAVND